MRAILYAAFLVAVLWMSARAEQSIGDVDASGSVVITDVVYLIQYIFGGGPEPRRTEWVEVDTTVSVVWILDRAFTVADYPITVNRHYYVAGTDTTWLREVVIDEATYLSSGNPLIRVR